MEPVQEKKTKSKVCFHGTLVRRCQEQEMYKEEEYLDWFCVERVE